MHGHGEHALVNSVDAARVHQTHHVVADLWLELRLIHDLTHLLNGEETLAGFVKVSKYLFKTLEVLAGYEPGRLSRLHHHLFLHHFLLLEHLFLLAHDMLFLFSFVNRRN